MNYFQGTAWPGPHVERTAKLQHSSEPCRPGAVRVGSLFADGLRSIGVPAKPAQRSGATASPPTMAQDWGLSYCTPLRCASRLERVRVMNGCARVLRAQSIIMAELGFTRKGHVPDTVKSSMWSAKKGPAESRAVKGTWKPVFKGTEETTVKGPRRCSGLQKQIRQRDAASARSA